MIWNELCQKSLFQDIEMNVGCYSNNMHLDMIEKNE
jgi:hypothetical protein